jgi:hypothetical protein
VSHPAGPQNPDLEALQAALESSRTQLRSLRAQVQQHEALAQASAQATTLKRERDDALRALGEGVVRAVREGQLRLGGSLERLHAEVLQAEQRREAHSRRIDDLLAEGEAAAERLQKKSAPPRQTGLAPGPRRR